MNLQIALIYEGFAEGLTLATKLGVDVENLIGVIHASMVRSGVVDYKAPFVLKRDFTQFPPASHAQRHSAGARSRQGSSRQAAASKPWKKCTNWPPRTGTKIWITPPPSHCSRNGGSTSQGSFGLSLCALVSLRLRPGQALARVRSLSFPPILITCASTSVTAGMSSITELLHAGPAGAGTLGLGISIPGTGKRTW